jgi:hypothetical protein
MSEAAVRQQDLKKCPACVELVLADAMKCKHCGEQFDRSAAAGPVIAPGARAVPVPSRRTTLGAILGTAITTILFCLYWFEAWAIHEGVRESQLGVYNALGLGFGVLTAVGVGMLLGQLLRGLYPPAFMAGRARPVLRTVSLAYSAVLFVLGEVVLAATEYIPVTGEHHVSLLIISVAGAFAATALAVKLTPMRPSASA